jgi:hypothetical protein
VDEVNDALSLCVRVCARAHITSVGNNVHFLRNNTFLTSLTSFCRTDVFNINRNKF